MVRNDLLLFPLCLEMLTACLLTTVLRTLLYPVTAILGPFINDAVGRSLSEGAKGGFGLFGNAANSCESRKLESEADLVALR
jgi:hypothetical protein